jgi:hypothetical protein
MLCILFTQVFSIYEIITKFQKDWEDLQLTFAMGIHNLSLGGGIYETKP